MTETHKNYLKNRSFDPEQLEQEWGLLGTGHLGEYKYRIIIPIHHEEKLVCYQGRSIGEGAPTKYKSCHDEDALRPIKSCLYGIDKCMDNDWIVITEGVTKVWRLGAGAVATFGVIVTNEQLSLLKQFEKRIIIFDRDDAGQKGAEDLASKLSIFGGLTEILYVDGVKDVADISQEKADMIMKKVKGL